VSLDERGGQLVARLGSDRHAERFAFERAYEIAVAGVPRVGEKDLVVAVDEQRQREQQRRGGARGDDDALCRDLGTIMLEVVPGN